MLGRKGRGSRVRSARCVLPGVLALLTSLTLAAQTTTSTEYQLKASFLTQFPNFIEWPDNAFPSGGSTFRVCVLGVFDFGTALAEAARAEKFHGRKLEVRWVRKVEEVHDCQILFVSHSESGNYTKVIAVVGNAPILTVGETSAFLRVGGAVSFSYEKELLQFEVNMGAADVAHLKVSSHLLGLARRVVTAAETKG